MVRYYSTGDGNVSFHKGTLAPPGEYNWTCASFGPLESTTETANGSVHRFCTDYRRKCLYFTMGAPINQNCPFPWGVWTFRVTHDALGPYESTTQTAPQSVQPSLHRWPRSVYTLQWFACSPSKLPLPMLASGPHVICDSLDHPSAERKWQLDRFSRFCRADRLTERQKDRQTPLLSAMRRNNA